MTAKKTMGGLGSPAWRRFALTDEQKLARFRVWGRVAKLVRERR